MFDQNQFRQDWFQSAQKGHKNFAICRGPATECLYYDEETELACDYYEPGHKNFRGAKRCKYYFADGNCTNIEAQEECKK